MPDSSWKQVLQKRIHSQYESNASRSWDYTTELSFMSLSLPSQSQNLARVCVWLISLFLSFLKILFERELTREMRRVAAEGKAASEQAAQQKAPSQDPGIMEDRYLTD